MARRRRGKKRNGIGRLAEAIVVIALLLVVLTFGFSIANRFAGGEEPLLHGIALDTESASTQVPVRADASFVPPELPDDRIGLIIENGCRADGLARWMAAELRGPRFDVVDYRNADSYDHRETTILANDRGRQAAQDLLAELSARYGVGQVRMTTETIYGADIRLILGADLADVWKQRSDVP